MNSTSKNDTIREQDYKFNQKVSTTFGVAGSIIAGIAAGTAASNFFVGLLTYLSVLFVFCGLASLITNTKRR